MMNAIQRAVIAPSVEVVVHGALGRQILRDRVPLAACAENIHDAVDNFADVHRPLVATTLGRWDFRFELRPVFVGQVTLVAQAATVVAAAVLSRPHVAPLEAAPRIESDICRAGQAIILTDSHDSLCSRTDTEALLELHAITSHRPNLMKHTRILALLSGVS